MDTLIRGNSVDGTIRIFVAITTDLVNEMHKIHDTSATASAALGRLLTGAAMMGAHLKSEDDATTLQVKGDGPIGLMVAVTDSQSRVRGYMANPHADLPENEKGKLDVGTAVGRGYLSVIRDLGLKEPYIGQTPLVSGEIAEDLTYYYATSEQVPSAIALGVLVNPDLSIQAAGGYMIQLMPGATDETADRLTAIVNNAMPVTDMIANGMSAQEIAFAITEGFDMLLDNNEITPKYECKCSRERMERALVSIGRKDIKEIIEEQGEAEMCCQFCDKKYKFNKDELYKIYELAGGEKNE